MTISNYWIDIEGGYMSANRTHPVLGQTYIWNNAIEWGFYSLINTPEDFNSTSVSGYATSECIIMLF